MKHRKRELDIFSLSFLDVISCGFGAVVMLILIAKTDVDVSIAGAEDVSSLLASLIGLENSVAEISQQIQQELARLEALSGEQQTIAEAESSLENQLKALQQKKLRAATKYFRIKPGGIPLKTSRFAHTNKTHR